MKLRIVQKIRFSLLESGWTKAWCPVWCLGRVPNHRNQWQEVEGLLFSTQKLSIGAYFELLFIGCGFLIHLSNRSDRPRFRAPWKKIHQKYDIQQEPSLFKGHPLSCQYGEALCSIVPSLEGLVFSPQNTNMNRLYSRTIHSTTSMEKHYVQWFILKSV